ncbi:hypothetical protein G5714_009972 [Onychostoma macrolepis]|uniref:Uncharacterized protein n=1 Tax=Onychostoma macrolepis TaxID=369639 RepID=A0A7J6CNJ4_9TELE|nr:hypothetical protein G5714_009972 [Onychostoma macrolepis]
MVSVSPRSKLASGWVHLSPLPLQNLKYLMQTVCVCWGALAATDECLIISTPAVHSKKSIIKAWGIFQFDAQQAEPEIKGSYVSSTQTSLPEQASVRELSFSKREASPPQTTQSHFCLPACEGVCVLCVSASEG